MPQFTPKHDHERTDAKVRPLAYFFIAVFVLIFFAYGATTLIFELFTQRVESKTEAAAPLQVIDEEPPAPNLQVVPGLDLVGIRAEENERLSGYGWVDEASKTVHIPIDKAMEVLVERGVSAVAETPAGSGE